MTLDKKTLFALLLGLDLLANTLVLTNINYLYTTTFMALCAYTLLPGFLISLIFRIKKVSFWENLLLAEGLSIIFLELGGLLTNILLPLFNVNDPLAFQNIFVSFNVYMLLLFILAWVRTEPFTMKPSEQSGSLTEFDTTKLISSRQFMRRGLLNTPYSKLATAFNATKPTSQSQFVKPSLIKTHSSKLATEIDTTKPSGSGLFVKPGLINARYSEITNADTMTSIPVQRAKRPSIEKVLYTLPVFFPILAALGAIVLNNGGSNILTMILLGAIALYTLLLVLLQKKIPVNLYPYAIFFIGLALLFTTSLRSWYITGHDIEQEFYVFELTNTHHLWNMAFYQDAYNACLSITILPTVLAHLLLVPDMYVYKVIFQILFATSPILTFFILKKYTIPILAFLSAFFFMAFPTFFNDMAMLNRQEIGFIFFGLAIYIMLMRELSVLMRRILFLIFGLGVIISHYSTNFVLLALVTSVYILTLIISLPFVQKTLIGFSEKSHIGQKNTFLNKTFLHIFVILLLFLMTFIWNNLYTNSSNHAGSVLLEVVSSLFVKANDASATEVSYSIFTPHPQLSPAQEIQQYIRDKKNSNDISPNLYYSKEITNKYLIYVLPQEELAPTPLGNWLTSLHISVFDVQAELRALSADFMQIFVFIGLLVILLLKNKKRFDLQYLLLCFGAIFLLVLEILLPDLSVEYGLLRMFQQFLFLLSLPIVLGLNSILFFVKEQKRALFTGVVAVVFFLNLTGFIAHLTGDYYPQLPLDNAGIYYQTYYVSKSDILAMVWLSKNDVNDAPVDTDSAGANKLLSYAGISSSEAIFPELMQQDAYVYQEDSNYAVAVLESDELIVNSAQPFLDANKNLIYNNGKNHVYK
jgi:uncharacterized membrane protein